MAMIDCQECGKPISDKAKACPHCGYSFKPKGHSCFAVLGVAVVALTGLVILGQILPDRSGRRSRPQSSSISLIPGPPASSQPALEPAIEIEKYIHLRVPDFYEALRRDGVCTGEIDRQEVDVGKPWVGFEKLPDGHHLEIYEAADGTIDTVNFFFGTPVFHQQALDLAGLDRERPTRMAPAVYLWDGPYAGIKATGFREALGGGRFTEKVRGIGIERVRE